MRTDTRWAGSLFRRFSLESFGQFLGPQRLDYLRKYDNPKRRTRKLGLEGFIWVGLFVAAHAAMPSLEAILIHLGQLVGAGALALPVVPLSDSAFSQFRMGFPLRVLMRLWLELATQAAEVLPRDHAFWRGLRLSALDGTALNVPEDLWARFGSHKGSRGEGPIQGHLVVFYDLQARVPVRFRLGANKVKERQMASRFLCRLGPTDLLLMDGGFYSIGLFGLLISRGAHFVIPMRRNGKPRLIQAIGRNDGLYEIKASRKYWKDVPGVPSSMTVRIVKVHREGFRPRRLVTNLLDPQAFPAEQIAEVYHRRWDIETFYRELKHTLHVQHWHARTMHGLMSELLFLMILATLTRLAMADASDADHPPGTLSFGQCLRWVNLVLVAALFCPANQWPRLYEELLRRIRNCSLDVRPGRSFERNTQKRRKASRAKRAAAMAEGRP